MKFYVSQKGKQMKMLYKNTLADTVVRHWTLTKKL